MSPSRRIALLFHARARDRDIETSVVYHLAPLWRELGHEVVFLRGTKRRVDADLLFVHVDLSVVPDAYLAFAARYPAAVNGRAGDIRKSKCSQSLLLPGDGWQGRVIAKSDLNYAGRPERSMAPRGWRRRLRRRPSPFRSWHDYPIFENRDAVPETYRSDPRVVLERFIPEVEGGLYHVRMYQFLGDRSTCIRMASPEPLVKAESCVHVEQIPPPPEAEVWRRQLGLDYGKLDYVVHEGRPVLIDANKTIGTGLETKQVEARRRHRAAGIESFFADSPPRATWT